MVAKGKSRIFASMNMKNNCGCIATFVVLVMVVLAMVVTRPDKKAHEEALTDVISQAVSETCDSLSDADDGVGGLALSAVSTTMASTLTGEVVHQLLSVDDYGVVTVGRIEFAGQSHPVSVGVFGHVFTADKDTIKASVKAYLRKSFDKMVDRVTRSIGNYAKDLVNRLFE